MICIDAEQLQDGLYNIKDGKIYKYKAKGGTVRTYKLENRPQGEWIESFKPITVKQGAYMGTKFIHNGWSCSECSEVVEKRYPNCPYCLARMKGVSNGMGNHHTIILNSVEIIERSSK